MKDTFVPSKDYITKKWYVIDATDQTLGRLATKASRILVGKEKATYTPYLDTGDYVIIVNAEKISVSGKKEKMKVHLLKQDQLETVLSLLSLNLLH